MTFDATGRVIFGASLSATDITTALAFSPVNKAGDTMAGTLTLPTDGLVVGPGQLALSGGKVGIGTTAPVGGLHITSGPQWSAFDYGSNIVVDGSRSNGIGLLDSTNANPWASVNTGGSLRFSEMPPLGNTATNPYERVVFAPGGNVVINPTLPPTDCNAWTWCHPAQTLRA